MTKTNQEILSSLMKSNKERRTKLAIKAGYKTSEDYITYLKKMIATPVVVTTKKASKKKESKVKEVVKPTIHIIDIIDCSGSMAGNKITNAIKGINNGILELKKDTSINYTYTICDFSYSHDINFMYVRKPLSSVTNITFRDRGQTALYDAIGKTLKDANDNIPSTEKVLVNIYTDGGENGSKKFTDKNISTLIEALKKNFTVTFIGTDYDVKSVIQRLNIDKSNTLAYDGSAKGLAETMTMNDIARSSYSASVKEGKDVSKGFYKNIVKK